MAQIQSAFTGGNASLTTPVDLQSTGTSPVFGAGTSGDTNNRIEMDADGALRLGTGAAATDTVLNRAGIGVLQTNGKLTINGIASVASDVDVFNAGHGVKVAEGSNAKQGTAALTAGTVVVANTSVTASSRIFLTCQVLGTVSSPSALCVSARTAGTSFTILASQNTDTSTIAYEIFEPG